MSTDVIRTIEPSGNEVFDELMQGFNEAMRTYQAEKLGYFMLGASGEIVHRAERLEAVDTTIPLDKQPDRLAEDALAVFVHNKRLKEANRELRDIEEEWRNQYKGEVGGLLGKKVRVASLKPGRVSIGTTRPNSNGNLDGLSQYHDEVTGKLLDLNLDLMFGGKAVVKKPFSKNRYIASELITPDFLRAAQFKVEFL